MFAAMVPLPRFEAMERLTDRQTGEYFGGDMATSADYCRGGRHMLVFAVLLDKSGVTTGLPGQVVLEVG